MPRDRKTSLAQTVAAVRRFPQTSQVWECGGKTMRMWVSSEEGRPTVRPYLLLLVIAEAGLILSSDMLEALPTAEKLFKELLKAMTGPSLATAGGVRPSAVHLDNAEYVDALRPLLAELGVRCEYRSHLPALQPALREAEKFMARGGGKSPRGLVTMPGTTLPMLGHLYDLASQFYRLAPWRWLGDYYPLEIRYPPADKARYVVVMGAAGQVFGLAAYDSLDSLRLMFSPLPPEQLVKRSSWLVLFLEEAMATSFDDLEAIDEHGWPVAAPNAYPVFGRTTRGGNITRPKKEDLLWLEGALAAIVAYVQDHMRLQAGLPVEAELTLSVATVGGEARVYLRMPAVLAETLDEWVDDTPV